MKKIIHKYIDNKSLFDYSYKFEFDSFIKEFILCFENDFNPKCISIFFTKKSINKIQINSYWYNVTLQSAWQEGFDEKYLVVTDSTDSNNLRSCFICKTDNIMSILKSKMHLLTEDELKIKDILE